MTKHLFLIGGGPPFPINAANQFADLAVQTDGPITILCVEREGWQQYASRYTQYLNVKNVLFLPLPSTPIKQVVHNLQSSSAIIIGGGDTNLYADYIVETPIASIIKARYEAGIPVAGFSAGALISPELCIISPKDNIQRKFQYRQGLGLIKNIIIAVHFSEWEEEAHLRNASGKFENCKNFGIDEQTSIYFVNDTIKQIDGNGVYYINDNILKKLH